MSTFLGIARERVFSPGRVGDDSLILEAVGDRLRRLGHRVRLTSAAATLEAATLERRRAGAIVFTMAQGDPVLATLRAWEASGACVVNSVEAILRCRRMALAARLDAAGLPVPETIALDLSEPLEVGPSLPEWLERGAWLKRGDVHAVVADDVVLIRSQSEASAAFARFRERGISDAVLQRHVAGVVSKFYAVAGRVVAWYPAVRAREPLGRGGVAALEALAATLASALGLEVYGGDVVCGERGDLRLIDVNDWPSFARCREAAARRIASRLDFLAAHLGSPATPADPLAAGSGTAAGTSAP